MAFLCTAVPAGEATDFPRDLAALGYKLEAGQVVQIEPPHAAFDYFHTEDERTNERRKEAMHAAVRKEVARQLAQFDVHPLFLHGARGTQVRQLQPPGRHVKVLATQVSSLHTKKDVIIVVGEAEVGRQDAGIWSYRIALGEGGIERGSAVGLAAKLQAFGESIRNDGHPSDDFEMVNVNGNHVRIGGSATAAEDTIPGLIILNPEQLLYSYLENESMTSETWVARNRENQLDDDFYVDSRHNFTPDQHISTFLEHVLPQLVREDSRLYMVGIGTGAGYMLDYLDQIFANKTDKGLGYQLEAVAVIEPDHHPKALASEPLKMFLGVNGRSWIASPNIPYGRLVQIPYFAKPVVRDRSPPFLTMPHLEFSNDEKLSAAEAWLDDKEDVNAMKISPGLVAWAKSLGEDSSNEAGATASAWADGVRSILSNDFEELSHDNHGNDGDRAGDDASVIDDDNDLADDYVNVEDEAKEDHADREDHADHGVSCPTFSAGDCEGFTEMVWPKVLDDVLDFFWLQKERAEEMDHRREILRRE